MPSINDLKDAVNTKTAIFVLLAIATAGIYPILWLYKNTSVIEEITKRKLTDNTFLIWLAVTIGLGGALSGTGEEILDVVSLLFLIASAVLYIIWAFKAKAALEEYALNEYKIDLRMNAFYTLCLTIYYVNYCINDLPEAKRKQEILAGSKPTTTA